MSVGSAGLLQGLGVGLVNRAKQENEDVMARRDAAIQEARDWRQNNARMAEQAQGDAAASQRAAASDAAQSARDEANNTNRRGLLSTVVSDETGNQFGVTEGGSKIDLGIKGLPDKGRVAADRDTAIARDKFLIETAIKTNTTKDEFGETVDKDAAAEDLRRQGRDDLANVLAPPGDQKPVSTGDDALDEYANTVATPATKKQIANIVSRKGGAPAANQSGGGKPAGSKATASAVKPKGGGTEQNPYKPTTQAEFDALSAGDVFINPADGKAMRKN